MYNLNAEQISNIKTLIGVLKNDVTDEQYNHKYDEFGETEDGSMCALGHAKIRLDLFPSLKDDRYEGDDTFGRIYNRAFHSWNAFDGKEVTRTMVIERLESILKETHESIHLPPA